ncbi:MAG: hypothetical protein ABH856_04165 [Patescibacteria group bacterium]
MKNETNPMELHLFKAARPVFQEKEAPPAAFEPPVATPAAAETPATPEAPAAPEAPEAPAAAAEAPAEQAAPTDFNFEIKAGDTLTGKIAESLNGDKKAAAALLAKMRGQTKGGDRFDLNRVYPEDKFEFTEKGVKVTRGNKEVANISLEKEGAVDIKKKSRESLVDVNKAILEKEDPAARAARLEKVVKQHVLYNVRKLLGLDPSFKARQANWGRVEKWLKGDGMTALAEVKAIKAKTADVLIGKGYKGTAEQNIAYCYYYLSPEYQAVELAEKKVAETAEAHAAAAKAAETARAAATAAETAKTAAATAKTTAETAKTEAETAKTEAETELTTAEAATPVDPAAVEAAKTKVEEAKVTLTAAETAFTEAETAVTNAETAFTEAETAAENAETAKEEAETALTEAEIAATAAKTELDAL